MNFITRTIACTLSATFLFSLTACSLSSSEKEEEKKLTDYSTMRSDLSTWDLVQDMGLGINLGNTLESCGDWINGTTVENYETAWGSPVITEEMIAGYKAAGFDTVRIPVAWSNLMDEDNDYTISTDLLDRVETVVQYVLDNDMYAIVNLHYDNGWIAGFSTDYDNCMEKYTRIWEQVSERFKNYGDHLVLESLNEEGCFDDLWNQYGSDETGKADAYGILNDMNQKFVDIVRSSGSCNEDRSLLIAGYATNIDLTCDEAFVMPEDPKNRCIVSVHYYTPSTFCILEEDATWGKARTEWGTKEDFEELYANLDKLQERFLDNDIPVIIGEYGCSTGNKEEQYVYAFLMAVAKASVKKHICPILWDVTDAFYSREDCAMIDPDIAEGYLKLAEKVRND